MKVARKESRSCRFIHRFFTRRMTRRLWQVQGLGFVSSSVALLRARFAAAGLTAPRASLGGPRSESAPRKDPRAPPGVVRALASPEA